MNRSEKVRIRVWENGNK
ncbi:Protein CBG25965 [Caenorhabditis briggsae]|uniref:Protein CBG25965 n=1 Tax=Caenorhabditis briggsae TaxID=6238 RepID=B6IKR5_CAEBR|nr:Protein CBG25965 [Caenorhabditis briggsae]CAS00495.1 Protein CBG25965 [Caenorhabditis briggsae]